MLSPRRSRRKSGRDSGLARGGFLAAALPLGAQLFALAPAGDTYLRSGSANQNQGAERFLRLQASGNNRALLRVSTADLTAAVGTGRLVTATLELYIQSNGDNWGPDGRTVDVHRLVADWSEAGATWNCGVDADPGNSHADCDPQWDGGTYADEPTDTVLHANGQTGWVEFDVTEDVAAFLAGEPNFGWLVKKTEENQNGKVDYTSREGAAGQRPKLVLLVENAATDVVPPSLAIVEPHEPILVNETSPTVAVAFADGGSGVDTASLVVSVDGSPLSGCSVTPTGATCTAPPLAAGAHTVHAAVGDLAGNPAEADFVFELLVGPGMSTVSFEAVGDTNLRQGSPNQNQGSEAILRVRSSGHNRALVRFDEAAIEAAAAGGATLRSATLELTLADNGDNWGSTGRTVDVHRLTADWSEPGATWNCAVDSDPGNQQPDCSSQWAGGAFEPTPTASALITNGLGGRLDFDVTADVAAFLAGTPNDGWIVKKTAEGASGLVDYASREAAAGDRPPAGRSSSTSPAPATRRRPR